MKKQKKIKTCRYSDEFWKNVWYTIRYGDSLGDRIIIPLLSLCILLCISFLIFLLTSCTADPLSVTAPEGTGTEGLRTPLTIGLLTIEGNDGYDGSVPATTRMATDPAAKTTLGRREIASPSVPPSWETTTWEARHSPPPMYIPA